MDEVPKEYLNDFTPETQDAAYVISKAATNAYTRILAKKFTKICINSICPGYVKTDLNHNNGVLTVEEGAESLVWLVLLPKGGPSKCVFLIENDTSLSLSIYENDFDLLFYRNVSNKRLNAKHCLFMNAPLRHLTDNVAPTNK